MIYTVRYAHLENDPMIKIGTIIKKGMAVGTMGNSGASQGAHLHIDCVEGKHRDPWTLQDMERNEVLSAHRQIIYFRDNELFNFPLVTTTGYNSEAYFYETGKCHLAYDVVPEDRHRSKEHFIIYWNRSFNGEVLSRGYHIGYGNYMHILFET